MTGTGTRTTNRDVRWARPLYIAMATLMVAGCSLDKLLSSDQIPPNVTDPAITKTPDGALAVYRGTVKLFENVFAGDNEGPFVAVTGLMTDELRDPSRTFYGGMIDRLDFLNPATIYTSPTYPLLQKVRGQSEQAIGLLTDYVPGQQALAGHAYALEGYVEVFLAELFCSGIPLTTLDYSGTYTLRPGSTNAQVLTHAAALFDTALTMSADSAQFLYLAAVGKGRALLGLGEYAAAASAVAEVPNTFRYEASYNKAASAASFVYADFGAWPYSVANHEGVNGLMYIASADPRVSVMFQQESSTGDSVYVPNLLWGGSTGVVVASGVEARLIEAEAALQAGDPSWLTVLNALRTDGTQDGGGVYNPGGGGVGGLSPLSDPGTAAGRVDLVFRERAFWLFLTGHRQGDLRRLIRQYGRLENQVYPTGPYGGTFLPYGSAIAIPVPLKEQDLNPLYTGCASYGA